MSTAATPMDNRAPGQRRSAWLALILVVLTVALLLVGGSVGSTGWESVLRMRDDLDRLSKNVDKLANAANEIDKRLIRIETMVEIAEKRSARQARLPAKQ